MHFGWVYGEFVSREQGLFQGMRLGVLLAHVGGLEFICIVGRDFGLGGIHV